MYTFLIKQMIMEARAAKNMQLWQERVLFRGWRAGGVDWTPFPVSGGRYAVNRFGSKRTENNEDG